ncbi:hypothetical protein Mapa_008515 [Marchantia paleacea]|nr:hypothetical protein Mapa_008515 [Marchantia paleacea]
MDLMSRASHRYVLFVRILQLTILLLNRSESALGQLTINANTPRSTSDGTGNTIMGTTGSTIASALLASGTPALMWGMVPVESVNDICRYIQSTGSYSIGAHVTHNWNDNAYDLQVTVAATGGCLASTDGRGTEIVFDDQDGRRTAVVCLDDASTNGCAVWATGDDVNHIFNEGRRRRLLSAVGGGRKLSGCSAGAIIGGVVGAVVGYNVGLVSCFLLYPTIVGPQVCVGGVIVVSVAVGVKIGCEGCFPGDALVQLPGGIPVPMKNLAVGDKVAVWRRKDNAVVYEDIYAFGHKKATAVGVFVRLILEHYSLTTPELNSSASPGSTELELTALHFIPTALKFQGKLKMVHKRAQDIQRGEYVWADGSDKGTAGNKLALFMVKDVSVTFQNGLYNPLTMSGTIIVSGVVASVHSEWFLDHIFDALRMSSSLPVAYQLVLSPVRFFYRVMGKHLYAVLYNVLDNFLNLEEFGTNHGGKTFGIVSACVILGTLMAPLKMRSCFKARTVTISPDRSAALISAIRT